MSFNDAEGESSPYPHQRPPGQWRITRSGVTHWARELSDGGLKALPLGRGPLRAGNLPGRWWPDDFRFEPGLGRARLRGRHDLHGFDSGWLTVRAKADQLAPPIDPADAGWGRLPAGTTDVAVGGRPARPVAYSTITGEGWWWDPVNHVWQSWGVLCEKPAEATLTGCREGVLLLKQDAILWLLADHTNDVVVTSLPGLGRPLAAASRFKDALYWPSSADGILQVWRLQLSARPDDRADPRRYDKKPELLSVSSEPVAAVQTFGRAACSESFLVMQARHGHVLAKRMADGAVSAQWNPNPPAWTLLEHLSPWLRADGKFELQLRTGDGQVGRLNAGEGEVRLSAGVCATLGHQRWRGLAQIGEDDCDQMPLGFGNGRWLLPVVETTDGAVMLDCEDATAQPELLLASERLATAQEARLALLTGNRLLHLNMFMTIADCRSIRTVAWRHQLLIFQAADAGRAILLETPSCASSWD